MPDSSSCSIFGKINNGMIRTELRILVKKYCSVEDHLGFVFFGGQPDMFRVEGGRVQLSEPKMWVGIEMSPGRAATRMTGQQKNHWRSDNWANNTTPNAIGAEKNEITISHFFPSLALRF